jgi:hypothetical protein
LFLQTRFRFSAVVALMDRHSIQKVNLIEVSLIADHTGPESAAAICPAYRVRE